MKRPQPASESEFGTQGKRRAGAKVETCARHMCASPAPITKNNRAEFGSVEMQRSIERASGAEWALAPPAEHRPT